MSSYKYIKPIPLMNATISGTTPILSLAMQIPTITVTAFQIAVGAGLNATFQLMVSMDGISYYDTGKAIDPSSGSAAVILVSEPNQCFPYTLIQVTPSSGSANVTITGTAKT